MALFESSSDAVVSFGTDGRILTLNPRTESLFGYRAADLIGNPVAVLLALTALYGIAASYLCRRLTDRLRDAQAFSATLDQLKKDHACLEKNLA